MAVETTAEHRRRNAGIDLLRGLSILLVVLHHIGLRVPLAQTLLGSAVPHWLLYGLNFNGAEAVVVFFVISGFLITRRSHERWQDLRFVSVGGFYGLRATRIVPLLLLLVVVLSAFDRLGVPRYVINRPGQSLRGAVAAALGLYLNRYEGLHGYLPGGWDVLWSLSIEEVFYLAFPIACRVLGRARLLMPSLALLALSLPFSRAALAAAGNEVWFEKAYLPGMSAIAVGVLAALLVRAVQVPKPRTVRLLGIAGWAGLSASLFAGHWVWTLLHHAYGLLLSLSAAGIVVSAHWKAAARRQTIEFRGLSWLRSWGRLSYEIYLTHMFCVFGGLALFSRSGPGGSWRFLWYFPILLACWLLGDGLSRFFTLPIERTLRRRFTRTPVSIPQPRPM